MLECILEKVDRKCFTDATIKRSNFLSLVKKAKVGKQIIHVDLTIIFMCLIVFAEKSENTVR